MSLRICLLVGAVSGHWFSTGVADEDPNWIKISLDSRFRSEGAAAADLNNDGSADVIAGDVWYGSPKPGSESYPWSKITTLTMLLVCCAAKM